MKLLSGDVDQKKFGGDTPYRLFTYITVCKVLFFLPVTISHRLNC